MENCSEKLRMKKIFFFKSFIVSAIMLMISALILVIGHDYFAEMTSKMYRLNSEQYTSVMIYSLAFWKIIIIQFTLVPAIVLHLMQKHT